MNNPSELDANGVAHRTDVTVQDVVKTNYDRDDSEDLNPDTVVIDDFEICDSEQLPISWTLDGSGSAAVDSVTALHEDSTLGIAQENSSQMRSFLGVGLSRYFKDENEATNLAEMRTFNAELVKNTY